ncbi:MAG: EthD domain-containing protein [Chloroflexi bacterium]|nr:EthD domain-containing protein [Chloroflexota bacterium]
MIHQFIFAAPKPGMTEQQFQDYWINVHAVKYASKIPQIKQYSVAARLPFGDESREPLWSGLAEIWLANDEDQIASLQTPEFLEGARKDEPNWAAFWRSVVVDTEAHIFKDGGGLDAVKDCVKIVGLVKRKHGMTVEEFRRHAAEVHAPMDLKLPGIRRYGQYYTRDGAYSICEPPFDAVACLWFDNAEAVKAAFASEQYRTVNGPDVPNFIHMQYRHIFLMKEHWTIGPNGLD